MGIRSVLIVGAGIAGCTCAYFLGRAGITVTVVERAAGQRSSGSPVDVRGPALTVVERMHVLDPIRGAATHTTRLTAVDCSGRTIGWIPIQRRPDAVEISRSDLAAILALAAQEHAEFRFHDTVTSVRADNGGVEVTFEHAAPRRFDLVVGADGLHSTVRRLVFGPEDHFTTHLGLYIATIALDRDSSDPHSVLIHNTPGRAAVIHPVTGREGAAFVFRHPPLPTDQTLDPHRHKQLLATIYHGMGWRVPELIGRVQDADDLYFDAICRVRVDRWSRERTVLIGDAANCVSLLGEGSSMAITGAAALAGNLARHPTDIDAALERYERAHRRRLLPHHLAATTVGHVLVPRTRPGIHARNVAFRTSAALAAARHRIRHHRQR